jgi:hypothetical protein
MLLCALFLSDIHVSDIHVDVDHSKHCDLAVAQAPSPSGFRPKGQKETAKGARVDRQR